MLPRRLLEKDIGPGINEERDMGGVGGLSGLSNAIGLVNFFRGVFRSPENCLPGCKPAAPASIARTMVLPTISGASPEVVGTSLRLRISTVVPAEDAQGA